MGRKIKPTDLGELLTENIQRCLSLADMGNFHITGAYLSLALDKLGNESKPASFTTPDANAGPMSTAEQIDVPSLTALLSSIQDVIERIEARSGQ